jgi:hypothetical protein
VPADARGEWSGGDWQVRIYQSYQDVEGEARLRGQPVAITEPRLSGSQIAWTAGGTRFSGRVEGGRMVGELVEEGKRLPLTLTRIRSR